MRVLECLFVLTQNLVWYCRTINVTKSYKVSSMHNASVWPLKIPLCSFIYQSFFSRLSQYNQCHLGLQLYGRKWYLVLLVTVTLKSNKKQTFLSFTSEFKELSTLLWQTVSMLSLDHLCPFTLQNLNWWPPTVASSNLLPTPLPWPRLFHLRKPWPRLFPRPLSNTLCPLNCMLLVSALEAVTSLHPSLTISTLGATFLSGSFQNLYV